MHRRVNMVIGTSVKTTTKKKKKKKKKKKTHTHTHQQNNRFLATCDFINMAPEQLIPPHFWVQIATDLKIKSPVALLPGREYKDRRKMKQIHNNLNICEMYTSNTWPGI